MSKWFLIMISAFTVSIPSHLGASPSLYEYITLLLRFVSLVMIVYTSQLVPAVTELVVAELMYLQWMDPKEPIYIYINSTGTTRDDGETVIFELASRLQFV